MRDGADALAREINAKPFSNKPITIVGHSMGGLIARLALMRHHLPSVSRLVMVTTPNHGTINGSQLNLLSQMTTNAFRKFHPIYSRVQGVAELTIVPEIVKAEMLAIEKDRSKVKNISNTQYVSIPAQFFNAVRQFGDTPPSLMMGTTNLIFNAISMLRYLGLSLKVKLKPVHDGIVEERSNQLNPALPGSTNEAIASSSPLDISQRFCHLTHEAFADCDHVTIMQSKDLAELLSAIIQSSSLDESSIKSSLKCFPGRVKFNPLVN